MYISGAIVNFMVWISKLNETIMYIADLQINTHPKPSLKTQNCAFKELGSRKGGVNLKNMV
jgi:hypothetical protein